MSSGSRSRRAGMAASFSIPASSTFWRRKKPSRSRRITPPRWCRSIPLVGEFRVHYAGFFDPGFGYAGAGGQGSRAVLEVRSREVPFILEHGQIVGRLVYEKMLARPDAMYGQRIGSNYQAQGLKLSKHFRA